MSPGVLALIKVFATFACMLAGMRARLGIGWSILAGSLAMALMFGLSATDWLAAAAAGAGQAKCLLLAAIVVLVLMLSFWLEATGQTFRLMEALARYLPNPSLRLIFFPLLIGLLPMPGGAVFSAPMVKSAGEALGVKAREQALVNYWYRHVWEPGWPLYPGIILGAGLSGVPLTTFIGYTGVGTLAALGLGWWFLLRPLAGRYADQPAPSKDAPGADMARALALASPLLVAIAGSFGLEFLLEDFFPDTSFEFGIIVSLLAALALTALQNRVGFSLVGQSLKQRELYETLVLVGAIFTMVEVMERAAVVPQLVSLGGGTALFMAAVFAPALVGMVAGITMAFVGSTFPLLLGLLPQLGLADQTMPFVTLAFFSGYTGVMLSPLHICFAMTCQYFDVGVAAMWKKVFPMGALLMLFGLAWFWLLRS